MAQVIKRIRIPRGGYTVIFGRWHKLDWFNHSHVYATKIDGEIKTSYADTIAQARKDFGIETGRKKNPTITTSTLPIGEWSPAHAIRRNADGSVDILREKNSGKRRANISEGFMAGGVFHPIRHSADYDASRVGESGKKKRKAPAKKKAMATSRRDYGGDGSRYRNAGKPKYKLMKNGRKTPVATYTSKSAAQSAWKQKSLPFSRGKSPYWVE